MTWPELVWKKRREESGQANHYQIKREPTSRKMLIFVAKIMIATQKRHRDADQSDVP